MTSVVGLTEVLNIQVTPTPGVAQDTNAIKVAGNTIDTGVGASGAGTQRVALSSDSQVAATQSGTWNINTIASLPSLAAGSNAIGSVSVSNFPATQPVSGTVAATQSGVWSVGRTWVLASGTDSVTATISGTPSVSVSNFPATQPVSGSVSVSNFPATQTVSGTVAATQSGTWNINSITTLPAITGTVNSKTQDGTGTQITSIADGAGQVGLGSSIVATNFVASAVNSTTTQLGAGATFTGSIETIYNQQAISLLLTSDQNGTLTLNQYIDLAGTRKISAWVFPITANIPFSRSFVGNGNYFNLTFQNTGASATTTLNINTAYGTLPNATNLGNQSVALNEVNGTALNLGQTTMAASLPVAIASNQSSLQVAVVSDVLPPNAAQETAGQLQNVADVLEQLLIEVRVTNALLSGLSQARPDDPELIRSDLINSLQ